MKVLLTWVVSTTNSEAGTSEEWHDEIYEVGSLEEAAAAAREIAQQSHVRKGSVRLLNLQECHVHSLPVGTIQYMYCDTCNKETAWQFSAERLLVPGHYDYNWQCTKCLTKLEAVLVTGPPPSRQK